MPEKRFLAMVEDWLEHPVLRKGHRSYSREGAWFWLIKEAKWRGIGHLQRGQLSHSLRFLGKAWGWQKDKVRRFLADLHESQMIQICAENATAQPIITICNYDKYQARALNGATATRQQRDSNATDSYQEKVPKEEEERSSSARRARATPQPELLFPIEGGQRNGRRSRLAADWSPSAQDRAFAVSRGYDEHWIGEQAELFRDHHIAAGNLRADWPASWRTWVQRAEEFTGAHRNGAGIGRARSGEITNAMHAVLNRRSLG